MRSKEFITEESDDTELAFKYSDMYEIPVTDALKAIYIKKNCQPFLQDCKPKGHPLILYRGINTDNLFIDRNVRLTDRQPLNTKKALHQKLNMHMEKKFGHPYRNGMFCTGNEEDADYGTEKYYVFPKGKYEFLYSNNTMYDDLFLAWQKFSAEMQLPNDQLMNDEVINLFLNKGNYSSDNIINAAGSGGEIMIWTNEYYGVRIDYRYIKQLGDMLNEI